MNLRDYVYSFPRIQRATVRHKIASALGISEVYVRSMCNGQKKIPCKYAVKIERATDGLVSRYVVAPELFEIE